MMPAFRERPIGLLRDTLQKICDFVWYGREQRMWSIPADEERDFDCILADAINELEARRALAAPAAGEAQPHEICICAAVRFADARIVRGHRHDSCFRTADGWTPRPDFNGCVQGFITSWDRFVDRVKGMDLMRKTARRSAHTGLQFSGSEPGEQLFSEDLYFDSHDHAAMPADPGRRAPAQEPTQP